jgi:hypothetical protein
MFTQDSGSQFPDPGPNNNKKEEGNKITKKLMFLTQTLLLSSQEIWVGSGSPGLEIRDLI